MTWTRTSIPIQRRNAIRRRTEAITLWPTSSTCPSLFPPPQQHRRQQQEQKPNSGPQTLVRPFSFDDHEATGPHPGGDEWTVHSHQNDAPTPSPSSCPSQTRAGIFWGLYSPCHEEGRVLSPDEHRNPSSSSGPGGTNNLPALELHLSNRSSRCPVSPSRFSITSASNKLQAPRDLVPSNMFGDNSDGDQACSYRSDPAARRLLPTNLQGNAIPRDSVASPVSSSGPRHVARAELVASDCVITARGPRARQSSEEISPVSETSGRRSVSPIGEFHGVQRRRVYEREGA